MARRLFTFVNTHAVIKAERILRGIGLDVEVIPTPKSISSECGMSLLVSLDRAKEALEVLENGGVEVVGVYEWDEE
ncbi:MAG: hypothetical protein DRI92_05840 [Aquificota bacterium]|nr:MAG: hypothetical protein DRI92_05840 [Aquificota bacterium]